MFGPPGTYVGERTSDKRRESEARVAAVIDIAVAQHGPNYTLFRHPVTWEFVPKDQLGMGIEEWRAQLAAGDAKAKE